MYRVYLPKVNPNKAVRAYFAGNKNKKTGLIIGKSQFLFVKTSAIFDGDIIIKDKPDLFPEIRLIF